MNLLPANRFVHLAPFPLLLIIFGCGDETLNTAEDTETVTDHSATDSETTDTETDTTTDPDAIRIARVIGTLLNEDDSPCADCTVQVCIPQCLVVTTGSDGAFTTDMAGSPRYYNWSVDEPIHVRPMKDPANYTMYSASYTPTASDLGADSTLDTGIHKSFEVPADGVLYTAAEGAVVNRDGLSMTIAPGEIKLLASEESHLIRVLRFPLDEWIPPFLDADNPPDILYYVLPYAEDFISPDTGDADVRFVDFWVNATLIGWEDGAFGRLVIPGEYGSERHLICDPLVGELPDGDLHDCGEVSSDGVSITGRIPRLGWFGLVRDL